MGEYAGDLASGIAALGSVPAHWRVLKLRTILRKINERNRLDLPLLSVVREQGVILRDTESADENHNFIPDDLGNYRVVRCGQFAMNKMKAWQGSYGVSEYDGIVSPAYFVFEIEGVTGSFLNASIRSKAYVPFFAEASDGVRVGQWDLSQARMREIPFLIPPLAEQRAIVRYLDHADRRIRRYVGAKRKLIGLLEEEKQAVINQAVTRGLDPSVPLKPSGVEWLGDVPEHWEVSALKWHSRCRSGNGLPADGLAKAPSSEQVVPAIGGNGQMGFTDKWNCNGNVLAIGRVGALCGNVHLIEDRAWISDNALVLSIRSISVSLKYIAGVLRARNLNDLANKTAQPLITGTGVLNERVPLPPIAEQATIVEFLDEATDDIDAAITRTRRQIELIEEYRTRLIADVVTGKLDVREAAAGLPDEPDEADQTADGPVEDVVERAG